jgi:hypothetical protein
MRSRPLISALLLTCLLSAIAIPRQRAAALQTDVYVDGLAPGWLNWSWAQVDLANASPVHAGTASIRVSFGAWQGLYLATPGFSTLGFDEIRFFVHGGAAGGQHMNLYLYLASAGGEIEGPSLAVPVPLANAWSEVRLPLADLGGQNATVTGIVWQDSSGGSQPDFYLDDIAFASNTDPNAPQLSDASLITRAIPAGGAHGAIVRVRVSDPQGLGDLASVILEAQPGGLGTVALHDDGISNDGAAQDGVYGAYFSAPASASPGEYSLLVSAQDSAGHITKLPLGALEVLSAPGGQIPPTYPQRLGWGSNAWDENPAQDWQVASGVPWDYVYQYITYEWYQDGWGGNFVGRFVQQAWDKNYIPMVTVYMMLGLPPTCGEGAACYAQKLQNSQAVQNYLAALQEAASQAKGDKPVIFNLEPDFYGFMQQYTHQGHNQVDDPASYPVALNVNGYANNLVGFGQRMVDVVHTTAPNALVAPMVSMWATNHDPNTVTAAQAIGIAQQTAAFVDAMGGDRADLLVVEWSDRDAGRGIRPWWDISDQSLPRPTRAILWENALSVAAGKRLLLWQVPVGNMALDNTPTHYQDNRAAYLFGHPQDMQDAGVIGVLFGGGDGESTQVDTDGGFVASQGAIYYAAPAAPQGLQGIVTANGALRLIWQENSEPDLAGYQVSYRPAGGGEWTDRLVDRRNHTDLILPSGTWQAHLAAYDVMGNFSPVSAPIQVELTAEVKFVFLALTR